MLDKFIKAQQESDKPKPKHIAIAVDGNFIWSERQGKPLEEAFKQCFVNVNQLLSNQIELNIPIMTIYIRTDQVMGSEHSTMIAKHIINCLEAMRTSDLVHKNKVKISILGKWYDLPGSLVDSIRKVIYDTKDYDSFFFNFCLNYNGQEEIVDACRLIARKIEVERLNPSGINKETVKENLYSSYYLPPDLMIITGEHYRTNGFLLWDSAHTTIYFSNVLWPDFKKANFYKALEFYNKV